MNILGILRSTYLYTALTIAGGAIVVAAVSLLALGLQLAGVAETPPLAESVRETVSGAVAMLIFAVPVGAIHLWLVRRSLRDPDERISDVRHLFLNAWIVVGLLLAVISISGIAQMTIAQKTKDVAFPVAAVLGSALIALVGWRWREATPGARRLPQLVAALATLGIATVVIVSDLFPLMGAVMEALQGLDFWWSDGYIPAGDAIWAMLIGLAAAFGMWAIGLRWQWPWRDVAVRTAYAAVGYGIGIALVALPGSDLLARLIGVARGGVHLSALRNVVEVPVVGLVLVAMHLPWLLRDRGRISYPARVTDRIVRGVTALAGLAALTIAVTAWGSVIVQDWLRIGPPQDDPLRVRDQAIATLLIAAVLYPVPWWGFLRAAAGDPHSSLRRAYLLVVACASLLGAIVAGVTAVTNLIQMALGATLSASVVRDTVDATGWLVIFAVVLGAHLWLLLRDMRAARAVGPIAVVRPVAIDPLEAVLADVAAGKMGTREAAIKIRALTALPGATGKTA